MAPSNSWPDSRSGAGPGPALPPIVAAAAAGSAEADCIPPYAIFRQPAMHAGAVDTAAAGSLGHTLPLSDQQQRLYPAIHTRLAGCLQGRGEPPAIRTAEPYPMASGRFSHAPERAYSAMV